MPQAVLKLYAVEPPGARPFHRATLVCHDWPVGGRVINARYLEAGWVTQAQYVFDVLCQVDGSVLNRCATEPQRTFVVAWDHTPVPDDCDYLLSCYRESGVFHLFALRGSDDRPTKSD